MKHKLVVAHDLVGERNMSPFSNEKSIAKKGLYNLVTYSCIHRCDLVGFRVVDFCFLKMVWNVLWRKHRPDRNAGRN